MLHADQSNNREHQQDGADCFHTFQLVFDMPVSYMMVQTKVEDTDDDGNSDDENDNRDHDDVGDL